MSRCEHNEKITKFCITPSCNHFTSGGCQYCFKRYHCHIGQSKFIKQTQICDLVKYLTSFEDQKPKIRPLKQSIYNYFNIIKGQISTYLDCLSTDLLNKITYSYLIKTDNFNVFKKLKQKQYNKLTSIDLIGLIDFKNQNDPKKLQKIQLQSYINSTEQVYAKINSINNIYKQFQQQASGSYLGQTIMSVGIFYKKISDIYEFIHNQKINQQQYFKNSITKRKDEKKSNLTEKINQQNNSSSENSDEKVKEFIEKKTGQINQNKKMEQVIGQEIDKNAALRPRKLSIDSRCHDLIGKSKLKTFQEKQKEIIQRKKKLEEIMSLSQRKKQPENVESSSGTSSDDVKNQQGYYSENDTMFQMKNIKNSKEKGEHMIAHTLLPAGKQDKKLYEEQQSVEKKTLKIPVNVIQENAEDEECQSPILRLKRSEKVKPTGGSSGFQLGLFKVQPVSTTQEPHSEPIHSEAEVQSQTISETSDKQNIQPPALNRKIDPNFSQNQTNSLYLLIQSLKLSGKKAIPLLKAALKYAPNNFSAVQYLTFLLLQQNEPKQCLRVCNQALKLIAGQPNSVEISFHLFNNKSAALNLLGRFSESIQILERCLQVCKNDILYKNLGDAYFSLGITEKAIINYENALILNDENHQALFNLAVCLYSQKNYDSAKLKVQRALMLDQKNQSYIDLYKQIGYAIKGI